MSKDRFMPGLSGRYQEAEIKRSVGDETILFNDVFKYNPFSSERQWIKHG